MATNNEAPALSQYTFELWRESDDVFKKEMRDFIIAQINLNLKTENRLTTVESRQLSGDRRLAMITALISSIVGAVGGFLGGKV